MRNTIFFVCFLFSLCSGSEFNRKSARELPNIVFIFADDLGYGDVSFQGQKRFTTPHIDRLAKEGLVFTQHYSGSTVCAPSRCSFLTGKHTGHADIRGNRGMHYDGNWPMRAEETTIAEMLKEKEYVSGVFGKWGLGANYSEGSPLLQGFDQFFGYNSQKYAHSYYPHYLWDNNDTLVLPENEGTKKGLYAPEMIHNRAKDFIVENKNKPFFLYYASVLPHAELIAPDAYMEKFRGKFLPEKQFQGELIDSADYRHGPYDSQEECHTAFAAMITYLDDQVGDLMKTLEDEDLLDNTLVIFTSDNGPHSAGGGDPMYFDGNGPFRGIKTDLYEGGIRVPMIAFWPGQIKAGKTDLISANWDFMPTFAELANITPVDSIDGISMVPTLFGNKDQKKHDHLYWEYHNREGIQAIRKGDWKAVRRYMTDNPIRPIELYNLANDIGEKKNIAKNHPDIVQTLDSLMLANHSPSRHFPFQYERQ